MTNWLSPSADAALRGINAPPMSVDFADRLMARLEANPMPKPDTKARADRRGPWSRGRVILMSAAAAGLISVGAAATGLFGVSIRNMPVVGTFVERIAPAKVAKAPATAKPVQKRPAAQAVAAPVAEPVATDVTLLPPPLPGLRREIRREVMARRIADRMEQRAERREALGLPPRPHAMTPQMRERLRAMPPWERKTLMRRVRELREGQVDANALYSAEPTIGPETGNADSVGNLRWRDRLTPEQREQIRERRERRRAMREARAATGQPELEQ